MTENRRDEPVRRWNVEYRDFTISGEERVGPLTCRIRIVARGDSCVSDGQVIVKEAPVPTIFGLFSVAGFREKLVSDILDEIEDYHRGIEEYSPQQHVESYIERRNEVKSSAD